MRNQPVKRILPLLLAALVGLIGAVAQVPVQAVADEPHPYTTPGERVYEGRQWNTVCTPYSATVERCRAEIFATQARVVDGKYQLVNEYVFNNLTYLASNGANWKDRNTGEINPLATDGQFTGTDGRLWKTECATDWTGPNGCRSFTFSTVINSEVTEEGRVFTPEDKWVFNNVVQFLPGTRPLPGVPGQPVPQPLNPCKATPPAGYTFTDKGRPHVIKTPYEPNHMYNPISLANFIKVALRSTTLDDADRLCFALLGAEHLLDGADERTYQGKKSLWFPYPFDFNPNPGVDPLQENWYSGLGQAGAMTALLELGNFTGSDIWFDRAEQVFESYFIPFEEGGFTNRSNGFLWFEEYPTQPPTVVYNGHFQAVLALRSWYTHSNDPRAKALFDEAVEDLKVQVPRMQVPIPGGTMSSYDMLRGYAATRLRLVADEGYSTSITETLLNGKPVNALVNGRDEAHVLPVANTAEPAPNLIPNPKFADADGNGVPDGWGVVNGNMRGFKLDGAWVGITNYGTAWAGLEKTIPVTPAIANKTLSLAFNSRLQVPEDQVGTSGKVPVYSICTVDGKTVTKLIHENPKNRTKDPQWSTTDFRAPQAGCSLKIQLLTYNYTVTNTIAWYSNVTLRLADALGEHALPEYDLEVHKTPENILTIKGKGRVTLEAYDGGRWLAVEEANLDSGSAQVKIPERFTGRNVNINYHDGHISELQRIACYSGVRLFDDIAHELSWTSTRPYDPTLFGSRGCVPESVGLEVGDEVVQVMAEPAPMEVTPAAVPTSMELPSESE